MRNTLFASVRPHKRLAERVAYFDFDTHIRSTHAAITSAERIRTKRVHFDRMVWVVHCPIACEVR